MKKSCLLLIILSFLFQFAFVSCDADTPVYTINYVTRFGEVPKSIQVASFSGLEASQLPVLEQTGYIFDGWYLGDVKVTDDTLITKNSNLVAKWRELVYVTVTYSSKYGEQLDPIEVIKGNKFTEDDLPKLTASGYEFDGWYLGKNKVEVGDEIIGDSNLVANWKKAIFKVNYFSEHGYQPGEFFVEKGKELTSVHFPTLSAKGYQFDGWATSNGEDVVLPYTVMSDTTFYAVWTQLYVPEEDEVVEPQDTTAPEEPSGSSASGSGSSGTGTGSGTSGTSGSGSSGTGTGTGSSSGTSTGSGTNTPAPKPTPKPAPVVAKTYTLSYPQRTSLNKQVKEGYALTSSDLPTPKSAIGYKFTGWYDETSKKYVKKGDKVYSNMKLVVKVDKIGYNSMNWMSTVPDDWHFGKILGPGTHDAGATKDIKLKKLYRIAGADLDYTAKCQNYGIKDQLDMGVRFLDIRINSHNKQLRIYHGCARQDDTLGSLMSTIIQFLKRNPTEAVVVYIKTEKVENKLHKFKSIFSNYPDQQELSDNVLSSELSKIIDKNRKYFATTEEVKSAKMGNLRGKIVLAKKYDSSYSDVGYGVGNGSIDRASNPGEITSSYSVQNKLIESINGMKRNVTKPINTINACAYTLRSVKIAWGLFKVNKIQIPHTKAADLVIHPGIKNAIKTSPKGTLTGFVAINFANPAFCKLMYEHNILDSYTPKW